MNHDVLPFDVLGALGVWAAVCGALALIAAVIGLLGSIARYGFGGGPRAFVLGAITGLQDLLGMSPRRVWALTVLAFRESIRRKVLGVMVLFGICFLFAGWFMSDPTTDSELRAKIYVRFVLTAVSWLSLPPIFLLACWGLPDDIKSRSLHTVVTKPARRSEILVGRILGVSLVGTLILVGMAVVGYAWLNRALPESSNLIARVPVYGGFHFLDRDGKPTDKGINVGYTWEFRGYIEGNTAARGVWNFAGISERLLDKDGKLKLECNVQAFRTHKGDIEQTVLGEVLFYNPTKKIRASGKILPIQEYHDNVLLIGRDLVDDQNKSVDLFRDLVDNGKLQVEVACRSTGQFLGMARTDVFLRDRDALFAQSYFKAIIGTWCLMVLVVVIAVTTSTVLKGPVTFILTFVFLILGVLARTFMDKLLSDEWKAGGPIESIYRLVTHMNDTVELAAGPGQRIMQAIDVVPLVMVRLSKYLIPDLSVYSLDSYVIERYDVPFSAGLLPALCYTGAYLIPCVIFGYFCLRARELEAK